MVNNINWYYGIDSNKPANTIDLLSVVMHEIGHGLGDFFKLMNEGRFLDLKSRKGKAGGATAKVSVPDKHKDLAIKIAMSLKVK